MVHQYKNNGYNIVIDVNSGCVHIVDDVVYDIIEKYAKYEECISLLEYKANLIQFKKSSKPKAALKRVQEAIDKEARIKTYPIKVQKLLKGEKVKHRDCEEGFYFFAEERADIYIFQCDCCGKRVKIYK